MSLTSARSTKPHGPYPSGDNYTLSGPPMAGIPVVNQCAVRGSLSGSRATAAATCACSHACVTRARASQHTAPLFRSGCSHVPDWEGFCCWRWVHAAHPRDALPLRAASSGRVGLYAVRSANPRLLFLSCAMVGGPAGWRSQLAPYAAIAPPTRPHLPPRLTPARARPPPSYRSGE